MDKYRGIKVMKVALHRTIRLKNTSLSKQEFVALNSHYC